MSVEIPQGASLPPASPPVVNQALEPKWVRDGSESTKKAYQTALAFEEMLVEQLSKSLTATSGLGEESAQGSESAGGEEGSSSPAAGELSSMLPQALTSGVMNAGGLGLAAQMTRQLESSEITAQTKTTGGTGA